MVLKAAPTISNGMYTSLNARSYWPDSALPQMKLMDSNKRFTETRLRRFIGME